MMNEETRRKLRILNIGEFIDAYDLQEQDTQSAALPFDDRKRKTMRHLV